MDIDQATQQQWAFARVNSMLTGGKADPDLQAQIKDGGYKKKKKEFDNNVEEWIKTDETISLHRERYDVHQYLIKLNTKYEIDEWYSDEETISMYQVKTVMNGLTN